MATKAVAKPQLRRLLESNIKRNLAGAIASSIVAALLWKYTVMEPRKQRYADFYKNYDAEKEFQRMLKAGVFKNLE